VNAPDVNASVYRERRPAVPHPFVKCWWEQRVPDGSGEYVQRVLPDACADVIVSADGRATVVGPAMSAQLARLPGGERLRGLRFRTVAIGAALRLPAREIRDLQVPLGDVFGGAVAARIAEQVWHGELPPYLDPRDLGSDRRVEYALSGLGGEAAPGVAEVAGGLGLSERQLRRLVLTHTGLEPRMLRRVARFQRFLALADGGASRGRPVGTLAGLAVRAGYADQAHLSREVRSLSGLTPSALLAERGAPT
jgi:AraC-like DNA-binding protein